MAIRTLTGDLLCMSCGYNLRGLPLDVNCPECGEPIRRTWNASRQRRYPGFDQVAQGIFRDWLSQIARSAGLNLDGVMFVMNAISFTQPDPDNEIDRNGTAADFCIAVREYVSIYFNSRLEARSSLDQWGVRSSENVGEIVFALVEAGFLSIVPEDALASFNGLFTFEDLIGGVLERAEPA